MSIVTQRSKFNGNGHGSPYNRGVVFSNGDPIGQELVEEDYFQTQYALTNERYASLLQRHDRRKGTIDNKYLDYDQIKKVKALIHQLSERGYTFGEWMDWLALQAVRPRPMGQSALSVSNYALQSFFIDVSQKGQSDGLFNKMMAEAIGICHEFFIDCIAQRVLEGDPEELIRKGFESVAQARRRGIHPAMLDAMDDHFDALVAAVETAVRKKQLGFAGLASGENYLHYELGRYLAQQAQHLSKTLNAKEMEEFLNDPIKVYDFYNKHLQRIGIQLDSDVIDKFQEQREELLAAREEIRRLTTAAAKGGDGAAMKDMRQSAAKQHGSAVTPGVN